MSKIVEKISYEFNSWKYDTLELAQEAEFKYNIELIIKDEFEKMFGNDYDTLDCARISMVRDLKKYIIDNAVNINKITNLILENNKILNK